MFTNVREWIVEWGDCDPAGIVFYPRFFAAFDTSTSRLLEAATGKRKADLIRENGIIGWPMVDTRAWFMAPASFGDVVAIETRITRVGKSSFGVEHRLSKDGMLCVEATEVRVWAASRGTGKHEIKGVRLPFELVARLTES